MAALEAIEQNWKGSQTAHRALALPNLQFNVYLSNDSPQLCDLQQFNVVSKKTRKPAEKIR